MISCAATAAVVLLAFQPALAARIYNFLPVGVVVIGHIGYSATIPAGERSGSLGWPAAMGITVHTASSSIVPVCDMGFGGHADIQGGNYMTIGHVGNEIICTLCNSDHHQMQRSTRGGADGMFDTTKHRNSRTGC